MLTYPRRFPKPLKWRGLVLKSFGRPFAQPMIPASFAKSYAERSVLGLLRDSFKVILTNSDSAFPSKRERCLRRATKSLGKRIVIRCEFMVSDSMARGSNTLYRLPVSLSA